MSTDSPTFDLAETLSLLERTPAALDGLLRGSSPAWHRTVEGPDTWSAFDVVGHLIHSEETNFVPRALIILEHGENRTFDEFDRFAHLSRFRDWSMDELLDRFAEVWRDCIRTVRDLQLTEDQLSLRGSHPLLGTVTLRQLLATWAEHDLTHIGQIVRAMAGRYREEVGPWGEYLSVLRSSQ